MLTQEEYIDVLKLRYEGFTIREIADELGYHPATIARWIAAGGLLPARETDRAGLLIDERWARRFRHPDAVRSCRGRRRGGDSRSERRGAIRASGRDAVIRSARTCRVWRFHRSRGGCA